MMYVKTPRRYKLASVKKMLKESGSITVRRDDGFYQVHLVDGEYRVFKDGAPYPSETVLSDDYLTVMVDSNEIDADYYKKREGEFFVAKGRVVILDYYWAGSVNCPFKVSGYGVDNYVDRIDEMTKEQFEQSLYYRDNRAVRAAFQYGKQCKEQT